MLRFFLLLLALLLPSVAAAQTTTPSETQLRYNNDGVLKMQENDYEGAIARFQSSLAVGELNITYLNLGRSYFRLGRCLEAEEAFDAVTTSPPVASPSPTEIQAALTNFRNDLSELCTAEVVFVCAEPSQVGIDKSKPRPCEGRLEWPVSAGTHDAIRYDVEVTKSVTVASGESQEVELTAPEPKVAAETEPGVETSTEQPKSDDSLATKDIFGWFALGSSAVILGSAIIVDQAVVGPTLERAEDPNNPDRATAETQLKDQQTLNKVVIGTGVGLAVVGVTLLLWPDETDPSTVRLTPILGPDHAGAAAYLRW